MAHELAIGSQGHPSSFEITVDGALGIVTDDALAETTTTSGTSIEGTVDGADLRVEFSGRIADITVFDGETAIEVDGEAVDPVEYSA
ncbi:hypothetical protein [Natrononativus amylolyticus]|uniref:hypothetical protein n=1 Tax=Natrononativus amylolyticus TaxID=2963434 RepID=UPI0020CBA0A6|nr:hypothetical protein [Natrononativus amylolyticus]